MGLVIFSGFAELAVPPTIERTELIATIDSVTTGRGTAIGAAMLKGLDAIAEVNPAVQTVGDGVRTHGTEGVDGRLRGGHHRAAHGRPEHAGDRAARRSATRSRAPGARLHDRLRDNESRRDRACTRAQLGGRVFEGGGPGFGGGAGGGFGGFLVADAPTLMEVAERTGGSFHAAEDADQLREVFAELPREVATQKQDTEITWLLAALGALLAAAAVAASMRWSPYP